jgi:diguanylate cyclase (GGDEF)-like protein
MQIETREYQLLKEVTQLREEMARLQQTNCELQTALAAAAEHRNLMAAQLHNTIRQHQAETEERKQAKIPLETLIEFATEHREDLEVILQIINKNNDQGTHLQQQAPPPSAPPSSIAENLAQLDNRHHFDRYLAQQWQQMSIEQSFLTVILCSIRGLQSFQFMKENVIDPVAAMPTIYQQIAAIFDRTIKRSADLVIRHSATEFAIVLPKTPVEGARLLAKQLQAGVAALPCLYSTSNDWTVNHSWLTLIASVASTKPTVDRSPNILVNEAARLLRLAEQCDSDQVLHIVLE